MKIDARLTSEAEYAASTDSISSFAEEIGMDGLWAGENKHDCFLPLAVSAQATEKIDLGTAVAIAFSRSPMVTAQLAWDLQRRSGGRFLLGLGTQVKAHIERRFSMSWGRAVPQMHDYVGALRAVWNSFQTGEPLNYESEFYRLNLLPPVFNPGPIENPHIPVSIAGVNVSLAKLAGRVCDGFHVHPFHSPEYVTSVLLPAIREGAAKAGRDASAIELSTSVFVVTGDTDEERERQLTLAKERIAFYGSTPSYRVVLDAHGWTDVGEELHALSREGKWGDMAARITDDMVDAFAIVAEPQDVGRALRERYEGVVDRVALFEFMVPGVKDGFWRDLVAAGKGRV